MRIVRSRHARRPGRLDGPAVLVAVLALLLPVPAAAQLRGSLAEEAPVPPLADPAPLPASLPASSPPSYRIKPVEGAPAAPGVRRVIETFAGWTLICDEEKRRRICNASQSIVTEDGSLAFSWSLAATRGGEPILIVRAPVTGFPSHTVTLDFGADETVLRLPRCDASVCVGFLPLDAPLAMRIKARGSVGIRYRPHEGAAPVRLTASLDGLGAAIGSIR